MVDMNIPRYPTLFTLMANKNNICKHAGKLNKSLEQTPSTDGEGDTNTSAIFEIIMKYLYQIRSYCLTQTSQYGDTDCVNISNSFIMRYTNFVTGNISVLEVATNDPKIDVVLHEKESDVRGRNTSALET